MAIKTAFTAIGVMSGTSLDGLDITYCRFIKKKSWHFEILEAATIAYSKTWRDQLTMAPFLSGEALVALDNAYGAYIGEQCRKMMKKGKADFIASHGHTVFHQVKKGFTYQLGNGNAIAAATALPVIYDFRSLDVALGGQGAPLVPVGDRLLFGEYDICLNLGGIANLSLERAGRRVAFDVCYANMGLNYLAGKMKKEFDLNGEMASRGTLNRHLLETLLATNKGRRPALGREGFEIDMPRLLDNETVLLEDRMRTFCEYIAISIRRSLSATKGPTILVTGGGAFNHVLAGLLRERLAGMTLHIPERQLIEFKEALVFAFLGVLRARSEVNVLRSVTHASRDSCSGVLIGTLD